MLDLIMALIVALLPIIVILGVGFIISLIGLLILGIQVKKGRLKEVRIEEGPVKIRICRVNKSKRRRGKGAQQS
jgi:hypothetical protein